MFEPEKKHHRQGCQNVHPEYACRWGEKSVHKVISGSSPRSSHKNLRTDILAQKKKKKKDQMAKINKMILVNSIDDFKLKEKRF